MPDYLYTVIFAVFVVIQIIAWILFARRLTKSVNKKDTEMMEERENKLFRLYSNIEELMDAFEEYVDEVRAEIDRDHKELIEISRQAADVFSKAMQIKAAYTQKNENEAVEDSPKFEPARAKAVNPARGAEGKKHINHPARQDKSADAAAPIKAAADSEQHFSTLSQKDRDAVRKFATKAQKVRYLISCGLTESEVARELDIGKGEVHLISELEK